MEVQEEADVSMFDRIRQMLIKEFIQVFRDPRMRAVVLILPCIEVLVIGYAVNMDIRDIRTAVYDLDNTPASRELLARFSATGYFDVVARVDDDRQMQDLVDRSEVQIVLRINHGFAGDLAAGRTAAVQVICDGTDSNTAGIALSYVNRITGDYSRQILAAAHRAPPGRGRSARAGRFPHPGVVQREPGQPQLLRARRDRDRRQPGQPAVDEHGGGPREGDRHDRADHGHAHHARRIHPGQDAAVRADRLRRRDADPR